MYVIYTVTKSSGAYFEVEDYLPTYSGAGISNCEMMIPGTVDPNED